MATVGSSAISESLLDILAVRESQSAGSELTADQRTELIDQLIEMQLLADAAITAGLDEEPPLAAELTFQRLETLSRAAREAFRVSNPPTETELRQAYQANLSGYLETQYKARHILVENEDLARTLISELDSGADFATLAREHSTGPTGPQGGDLGWFPADQMVAPFADAVRAADPGNPVPEPVRTRFGWHVILVEDVQSQVAPGLEAVRSELHAMVEEEKLEAYLAGLEANAEIKRTSTD